ncbi:hypothetical protein BsWGS_07753 [Bradybaena similaris]
MTQATFHTRQSLRRRHLSHVRQKSVTQVTSHNSQTASIRQTSLPCQTRVNDTGNISHQSDSLRHTLLSHVRQESMTQITSHTSQTVYDTHISPMSDKSQ